MVDLSSNCQRTHASNTILMEQFIESSDFWKYAYLLVLAER